MKTNLYAYFGFLGLYSVDSPGHTFYQLGLIDSIKERFGGENFDFYSYYPQKLKEEHEEEFFIPLDGIGTIFSDYFKKLINVYNIGLEDTLLKIKNKEYNKIFLKARFRNLSTLAKKWDDTLQFETILNAACEVYSKDEIIILDTDLSLPNSFIEKFKDKVTILIPSIDFPGISESFLNDCVSVGYGKILGGSKQDNIVFYGNIDTSSYKAGNSKSPILIDSIKDLITSDYSASNRPIKIVGKKDLDLTTIFIDVNTNECVDLIDRSDRETLWNALSNSLIMLNISKDKYSEKRFIPARVYEAMIFGMIPVSYNFSFLSKAFSFSNLVELSEIIKYLNEVSQEDKAKAYLNFIQSYKNYANSSYEKTKSNSPLS